ncbi:hypothetical protein V5P93_006772 [Actinokineospora auranticolor]|uniref:Uncharacterized protein n=1 Tax=Actinokineospora auranticolor TaxID=155976 RepID=A0A2S6GWK6_9PSEU|nr:hypothetical protein [Actinokineospora auranticolor]PPK69583.1 hypothetical protein CLV40_103193 [Actinokineospora auranticolor]
MSDLTAETRLILAKYEDITAQYHARVNQVGEEFAAELTRTDAAAAERDRVLAEQRPAIDAAHEATKREAQERAAAEQQKAAAWTRETKSTVLSFGGDDERPQERPERPRPVPPPVAPPEPAPEARSTPAQRFLSFADDEDEPAPPPRPAPKRQAPAPVEDDGDDDWSGRSWVR